MSTPTQPRDFDPSELDFVTPGVSDTEISAVTAVLRGLLREESDDMRTAPKRGQTAWQVSQRGIRQPITPGHERWRSFSAR